MDLNKEYHNINRILNEMREEYKVLPSTFLKRQIELADSKLKAIDRALGKSTVGGGNYKNTYRP